MDHPYGWLSLLPPVTAIFLAIVTKRVLFSLLLGIFMGALVLNDWSPIPAVQQMSAEHLWGKLLDSDTLHVFCFTILMGTMIGMVNRAAGMKGLVNALTPLAKNRQRGQLTTWFLGLFVFFDDYANTMLLGTTLRPLTDKLKIAREKLAYLVDSTAAPVAGLALISTWVAGEIGYVSEGLSNLPVDDNWTAFGLFVQSIPYRFYVLFALLFVPMVAMLGRDFGPMYRAEKRAMSGGGLMPPSPTTAANDAAGNSHRDPTSPEEKTPARWFNAVIPVVVTVVAVVYFLYTSGAASTDSNQLMDIFGDADSYGSLLWGDLWGSVTAYVLIAIQRLIPFSQLHQAAADGARAMVPALLVLWLAQSMSTMTKDQDVDDTHQDIVQAMIVAGETDPQAVTRHLIESQDLGNQEPAIVVDALLMLADHHHQTYREQCEAEFNDLYAVLGDGGLDRVKARIKLVESKAWEQFQEKVEPVLSLVASHEDLASYLMQLGPDEEARGSRLLFASQFAEVGERTFGRWEKWLQPDKEDEILADPGESLPAPVVEYRFLYRGSRLYTGDFLSERLATLREGGGFVADNFVPLLPTLVFILASIVAFSTGTSWGTMGIVMPLVIPLAYSQLVLDGGEVTSSNPILLCCIGSVLAGAIFGDHCSPISDTTVLSSQASGCDHVAHVRTQLPYAIVVGLVSIVFGTLPIGYGVPVWILLPLGLAAMVSVLFVIGRKLED